MCRKEHLIPFLPSHPVVRPMGTNDDTSLGTLSAAPYGSPSILPISYAYIKMMGAEGLTHASKVSPLVNLHLVITVMRIDGFQFHIMLLPPCWMNLTKFFLICNCIILSNMAKSSLSLVSLGIIRMNLLRVYCHNISCY